MKTVQQIGKSLATAGLKKATTKRDNFQTISIGDYTARHLTLYGLNVICIQPKNGMTCEKIQSILSNEKSEIKNGYLVLS